MQAMAVITFSYSCSQDSLHELATEFATSVKPHIDGLVWKIYLNDPDRKRSSGLYLFRDLQTARAYAEGPYVRGLRQAPMVSDVSVETFQIMYDPSIQSGAPLEQDSYVIATA